MLLVVLGVEAHPGVGTSTPIVIGLSADAALVVLGGKGAMPLVVLDGGARPGIGTSRPLVVGLSADAALAVLGGKGAMSLVVSDGLAVLVDGGAHPGA